MLNLICDFTKKYTKTDGSSVICAQNLICVIWHNCSTYQKNNPISTIKEMFKTAKHTSSCKHTLGSGAQAVMEHMEKDIIEVECEKKICFNGHLVVPRDDFLAVERNQVLLMASIRVAQIYKKASICLQLLLFYPIIVHKYKYQKRNVKVVSKHKLQMTTNYKCQFLYELLHH